jgi:hypothetical protein
VTTRHQTEGDYRLLAKIPIADSIKILKRRFPGALICTACSRLIARMPAGYAHSNLAPEQIEKYVCAECLMEPVRLAGEAARLRTLAPKVSLKEPAVAARAYAPAQRRDESNAAYRRRVEQWGADRTASLGLLGVVTSPHPYFDRCLVNGRHAEGSDLARECPARLSVDADKSRAGSRRQQRSDSGKVSRLTGRRLGVRRQRTSPEQLAALARINVARRKAAGGAA